MPGDGDPGTSPAEAIVSDSDSRKDGEKVEIEQEIVDPETLDEVVDTAFEEGAEAAKEEIAGTLEDLGIDFEALFDPAPARRRKRSRRRRRRRSTAPIRRRIRTFRTRTRRTRRKMKNPVKKTLKKMEPYAVPAGAIGTFWSEYQKRARQLAASGAISGADIGDAIQHDIENFDASEVPDRLKSSVKTVATLLIGAGLIKETKLGGDFSKMLAGIMQGMAIGTLGKRILDPPVPGQTGATGIRPAFRVIRQSTGGQGTGAMSPALPVPVGGL
jgi:uncharacterized protein YcfJ